MPRLEHPNRFTHKADHRSLQNAKILSQEKDTDQASGAMFLG